MSNNNSETWELNSITPPHLFVNQALLNKLAALAKRQNIELSDLVSTILTGYLTTNEND